MKDLSYFKNYRSKNYLHIDKKISIKRVYEKIQNVEFVRKHAFLPFIHYTIDLEKYTFKEGHNNQTLKKLKLKKGFNQGQIKWKKPKTREINYASHFDSYIYRYYGEMLNEKYNEYAKKEGFDECSIAYRDNKKGKSNIHFAKEVFEFIVGCENALIIALDFSSFFDKISHKELKQTFKQMLNVNELPADIYNVFKSITKFRSIEKSDLDKYLKEKYINQDVNTLITERKIRNYMDVKTFREAVRDKTIKVNPRNKDIGIPQGSGMSAVCSNIRLINFDEEMNEWIKSLDGLYRRYCDDLIWVIPNIKTEEMKFFEEAIYERISKFPDLHLQKEKTIVLNYSENKMTNLNGEDSKLDYLGFVFDGTVVKMREKSLFKYYNRAFRKTKVLAKKQIIYQRNAYMRNLYGLYTHLGHKYKGYGNFVTYAYKAQAIMEDLPVEVQIRQQVKRHWDKIHKRLEKNKKLVMKHALQRGYIMNKVE
ncbi:hypothetical protein UACE39S_05769 [Ureibacillus acetophenoni]